MRDRIDDKVAEEIANEFLSLGFSKDDVAYIYRKFCDKYDEHIILEGTRIRRRYERRKNTN